MTHFLAPVTVAFHAAVPFGSVCQLEPAEHHNTVDAQKHHAHTRGSAVRVPQQTHRGPSTVVAVPLPTRKFRTSKFTRTSHGRYEHGKVLPVRTAYVPSEATRVHQATGLDLIEPPRQ